jgi:hypothetical protein
MRRALRSALRFAGGGHFGRIAQDHAHALVQAAGHQIENARVAVAGRAPACSTRKLIGLAS